MQHAERTAILRFPLQLIHTERFQPNIPQCYWASLGERMFSGAIVLLPCVLSLVGLFIYGPCRKRAANGVIVMQSACTGCMVRTQRALGDDPATRARQRRLRVVLLGLLVFCAIGYIAFEVYYQQYECKVSDMYSIEVRNMVITVTRALDKLGVPYWLDFATLLACIRGQDMLRWDQDSDIGAVHPGSDDGLQQLFTNIEQLTGYHARYRSHRWLLQLYPSRDASDQGVHFDVWLYQRVELPSGEVQYCNRDDQMRYGCRSEEHLFPLETMTYLNEPMRVPHAPHTISYLVYGASYGTTVRYRADCLHNLVHGRLWY